MVAFDGPLVGMAVHDAGEVRVFDECKDYTEVSWYAGFTVRLSPGFDFTNAAKTRQLLLLEVEVVKGCDEL